MKIINYSKIKKNLYGIEMDGTVISLTYNKIMKTSIDKDGYITISLKNDRNGYSHFGIHRLLMIAYKPIENMESLTVNHIDGNKLNNSLDNLEWVSAAENTYLAHKTGLHNSHIGENHPSAVLTEEEAKQIIEMTKRGFGIKEIRKVIPKVNSNIINQIKHNHAWKKLPR